MGRYKINREPLPALALTVDTSAITAIGNDYGYENVFSRQLKGIGVAGDILIAISTSGKSKNVIKAIETAKQMDVKVISFTGENHCQMNELSDICINAPSSETNHIQEMHITIGQLICGIVEETIFGKSKFIMVKKAIILAGGFGTRLKEVVADQPKPMADINENPFWKLLLSNYWKLVSRK